MKKILFVGTEVMPYAATGGLGDVLGSLPQAIKKREKENADVRVVMPLYSSIGAEYREKMTFIKVMNVPLAWRNLYCGIFSLEKDGVTVYFLDNEYYFKRAGIYGDYDDGERFAFFSKAVLCLMDAVDFFPDIMNANDWQSALSVIYLKQNYRFDERYAAVKAVFTIHNIRFQGVYGFAILGDVFDIDNADRDIVEYNGDINLMKGAIVCADKVTTVSGKYAEEILSPEYSYGLHFVLQKFTFKLCGILNGIDYDYYDPASDADIFRTYTVRSAGRKKENKNALQKMLGLSVCDSPMISVISRLTDQKGVDLIKYAMEDVLANTDAQFVILGKGEERYEEYFRSLEARYKGRVCAYIAYDRAISKKIYAASDIFLMPSKTEPCGLAQMIASRYGTVPVCRETGGLYDSIKGYYEEDGKIFGNGFTFYNYNGDELKDRIYAALWLYKNEPEKWCELRKKIMKTDFSWNSSAEKYMLLYQSMQ